MGDDLAEHRVVVTADDGAREQSGIDAHAGTGRLDQIDDAAAGRQEPTARILRVHTSFDGVPGQCDVALGEGQLLPCCHTNLPFDQIQSGHHFGDGVLDLQAGVHLHEEELVRLVGGDDELDSAGAGVIDASSGVARCRADPVTGHLIEQWRRSLFDDLLVAPLQAAFALTEVNDVAVLVGENLDLDVPGPQDESLEEQGVVAERRRGLTAGTAKSLGQIGRILDQTHSLATAACRRLDQHRVADVLGRCDQFFVGQIRARDTRDHRHVERGNRVLRGDLVAHHLDSPLGGAEEGDSGSRACSRERRVLRQEAVTGVNTLSTGGLGSVDDLVDDEVAFTRRGRSDVDGSVGLADVASIRVGVAVDGDAANSQLTQRADHANRDLTAVGHENSIDSAQLSHFAHIRKTP